MRVRRGKAQEDMGTNVPFRMSEKCPWMEGPKPEERGRGTSPADRVTPFEGHKGSQFGLKIKRSSRKRRDNSPDRPCGQVGDKGTSHQAMHSLDAQTLVGHDVEGRVLCGRCVLGGPDEAVSSVQDHVTSVGCGTGEGG